MLRPERNPRLILQLGAAIECIGILRQQYWWLRRHDRVSVAAQIVASKFRAGNGGGGSSGRWIGAKEPIGLDGLD